MCLRAVSALLFLLLAAALPAAPAAPVELHTFTDQFGRTTAAEILEVKGLQLKIRRADGMVFTLPIDRLSDEDTAYIAHWQQMHADIHLRLEVVSYRKSTVIGQSETGEQEKVRIETGYDIKITNDGLDPADGVRVEYALFQPSSSSRGNGLRRTMGFELLKPIPFKETATFKTTAVTATQSLSFTGTSAPPANILAGTWVRVIRYDTILAEFVSNDRIRNAGWQTDRSRGPAPTPPEPPAAPETGVHQKSDPLPDQGRPPTD